jgi:UDP-glucose 4-epimerase
VRALVTGGAGFIGSHLVEALLAEGSEVDALDDLSTGSVRNLEAAIAGGARLHVADVTEAEATARLVAALRPDVVFHMAAVIDVRRSVAEPGRDAAVNAGGTLSVLDAAHRANPGCRVLLASTAAVYGDRPDVPIREGAQPAPLSPYGAGKAAAEIYMGVYRRLHGLSTLTLRMANVYGPRQDPHRDAGVIAIFCAARADGRPAVVYGDGLQTRDYLYVGDAVAAFLAAARADVTGVLNISSGRETSIVAAALALGLEIERAPGREGEIRRSCLDPSAAAAALGWRATTGLEDGLARTVAALESERAPRA